MREDQLPRVTVERKRAAVVIYSFGSAPFAIEMTKKYGPAYVPSGFEAECKSDGELWIGKTLVTEKKEALYCFRLKRDPAVCSSWQPNPTAAYKEANLLASNQGFKKGSNGRLIIGVTYKNLQELIRQHHNLPQLSEDQVEVRKAKRVRSLPRMLDSEPPCAPKRVQSLPQMPAVDEMESVGSSFDLPRLDEEPLEDIPVDEDPVNFSEESLDILSRRRESLDILSRRRESLDMLSRRRESMVFPLPTEVVFPPPMQQSFHPQQQQQVPHHQPLFQQRHSFLQQPSQQQQQQPTQQQQTSQQQPTLMRWDPNRVSISSDVFLPWPSFHPLLN